MRKGMLIAFEGIDGSGLTTHSKILNEKLNMLGYKSIYTKEPTNNEIGLLIQEIINKKDKIIDNNIIALLFAADRLYHLKYGDGSNKGIISYIDEKYIVITDRYKYSNMAYQGDNINWVHKINQYAINADIIVFLEVPLDVALARISKRTKISVFENRSFLEVVKNRYYQVLEMAKNEGTKIIKIDEVEGNKEKSINEVSEKILKEISNFINITY
ncbi:MAG: dTMP kinase [Caldisphaera sp.]|uniref:dTMP kinase n=1 Tax=Caldisphaera sp. TaxID=2060322 RepID=UPI000CB277FD|nr:MAG: dTMP kinase [Caldisphaera sp.]